MEPSGALWLPEEREGRGRAGLPREPQFEITYATSDALRPLLAYVTAMTSASGRGDVYELPVRVPTPCWIEYTVFGLVDTSFVEPSE